MGENIKKALHQKKCEGMDRIHLAQDRVQWRFFENDNLLLGFIISGEFHIWLSEYQFLSKDSSAST
jgi:hypothetical protein